MQREVTDATRWALMHRLDVATQRRERDVFQQAQETERARIERVAAFAPNVRRAWWLWDMHRIAPVPLDGELNPTNSALVELEAILEHWQTRPNDTVGITTGPHPTRTWSYIAVAVDTFASWGDWIREQAAYTVSERDLGGFADLGSATDEVGPPTQRTGHSDTGAFSLLRWVPPPFPSLAVYPMDAHGGSLTKQRAARVSGRGGWIWICADDPDRTRTPKRDRKIAPGIRTLATGTVVPWEGATTSEGWSLRLESATHSQHGLAVPRQPIAPWLLAALTS